MTTIEIILVLLSVAIVALQIVALLQKGKGDGADLAQLKNDLQRHQQDLAERTERELRAQVQATAQGTRQELGGNFAQLQQTLATQIGSVATLQNNQIDGFAQQLVKLNETNAQQLDSMRLAMNQQAQSSREEQGASLKRFGDTLNQSLSMLTESNAQRMAEERATLEAPINDLQFDNGLRMEAIRKTVDAI